VVTEYPNIIRYRIAGNTVGILCIRDSVRRQTMSLSVSTMTGNVPAYFRERFHQPEDRAAIFVRLIQRSRRKPFHRRVGWQWLKIHPAGCVT